MKIYSVYDPEFAPYGKVLEGYDTAELVDAMLKIPFGEGVSYEPAIDSLEACAIFEELSVNAYGGMPVQLGMCWGHNTKLNCLEYHRDSEVNIGSHDFILLLALESDIKDGKLDTACVKAFKAPAGVAVTGAVKCFGDAAVAATVELWADGAVVYTATVADGAYAFENVAAGTYTLKVSKADHVTREYEIVVADAAVAQDVKIHLIGDVNGDGRLNTGDVSKMYAHAKKSAYLEGYEFACADINGDGRVNTGDTSKAYAHAKRTALLW